MLMQRDEGWFGGDGSGKDVGGGAWQSPFRSNASTQRDPGREERSRKRETVVLVAVEQTDSQKHQASESGTEETQPKHGHGADAA